MDTLLLATVNVSMGNSGGLGSSTSIWEHVVCEDRCKVHLLQYCFNCVKNWKQPKCLLIGPVYYIHKTEWWTDEKNRVPCADTDFQNIWTEKSKAQNAYLKFFHMLVLAAQKE